MAEVNSLSTNGITVLTCQTSSLFGFVRIGVTVNSPVGEVTCKARLLMCSADLPARASVLNMKKFNGAYACAFCEDEGEPRASSHLHRNWPYTVSCVPRTHRSVISNGRDALRTNGAVCGPYVLITISGMW